MRFGEASSADREIRARIDGELERGGGDDRFPLAPARIVADTRAALRRDDIVLVDTGALKMWMARLYPTYAPNTCLISNGLSTMAWSLPACMRLAAMLSQMTVVGILSFIISHAVRRAPCRKGRVSSA